MYSWALSITEVWFDLSFDSHTLDGENEGKCSTNKLVTVVSGNTIGKFTSGNGPIQDMLNVLG